MSSGTIGLTTIAAGFSSDFREIRIETFLFGWYGRNNRVPRVSRSVHSGLTSSDSRAETTPSCWYPRDSSIIRSMLAQCAGRQVRPTVVVATVRGHFLVPGRFTPAWHIGAVRFSGYTVTNSRDRTAENHRRWTRSRRAVSRQRDALHLRSDRHRVRNRGFNIICTPERGCVGTCVLAILVARRMRKSK